MNKAITDGIDFMPPAFSQGLDLWSPEDGLIGQATYASSGDGVLIAADADFGGCVEIQAQSDLQQLRYTGETPLPSGCYLRVRARVKVMSGNLPSFRIAAWAGDSSGDEVSGLDTTGPATLADAYGDVLTIEAIVGAGNRSGVDMVWGGTPVFGHFGLDIVGASGCIVRVESIEIEDATSVFHRDMMDWVDVRDYGAVGDGVTDDSDAFLAADNDAGGRTVLVPEGTYFIGSNITIDNHIRFAGKLSSSSTGRVIFMQSFDFATYYDAFKDEARALKAGLQALYNYADHDAFDLCGRRIQLSEPIDVFAAVGNKTTFGNRRVIRNGQLEAKASANWDPDVVTSSASYSPSDSLTLTGVANIAQIAVGSLVEGNGVGREVYVRAVDTGAAKITLSQPLYGGAMTQIFTFTRFKYLLDYSGFTKVQKQILEEVEFLCAGNASGVILPPDGWGWHVHHCWFQKPADRAITSIGEGCNGMFIDNTEFYSNDHDTLVQDRKTVALNTNKADIKLRNNRAVRFKHFAVMANGGHLIEGNHWWQGDDTDQGEKSAGIVLTQKNTQSSISGNYCDNAFIEVSNEHDQYPDNANNPFGALTVSGNTFLVTKPASWFTFLRFSPIGAHTLAGVTVTANVFKALTNSIDRVEDVNTALGSFDMTQCTGISFENNGFLLVDNITQNPRYCALEVGSANASWTLDAGDNLPFGGRVLGVEGITALGALKNSAGQTVFETPYCLTEQGTNGDQLTLKWAQALKGKVMMRLRSDMPIQ